jgi:hypothetical protein
VATIHHFPECKPTDYANNKQLKHLLIQHFGEKIRFSYPKEKNKSQLVLLSGAQMPELWTRFELLMF